MKAKERYLVVCVGLQSSYMYEVSYLYDCLLTDYSITELDWKQVKEQLKSINDIVRVFNHFEKLCGREFEYKPRKMYLKDIKAQLLAK